MAGAFGYGTETYDISIKMAEAGLLPKLRLAEDDAVIVADGTSCRCQISDRTGRTAEHVAKLLATGYRLLSAPILQNHIGCTAIIRVGGALPEVMVGITEASATRKPFRP